ncbi:MAG: serine/threonine-protein kinase [Sumerlaeia bacterium]
MTRDITPDRTTMDERELTRIIEENTGALPRSVRAKEDLLGKRLARYSIEKFIGRGATGDVFQGRHVYLDKIVAVKVLSPALVDEYQEIVWRFVREGRAAARVLHPNVAQIFDFDCFEGLYFLVMELVEGEALGKILRDQGPMEEGRALRILRRVMRGLRAAWVQGLVHRDVKPGNILIAPGDVVKVVDFGLARKLDEPPASDIPERGLGTPRYCAPEQYENSDAADQRSDIYALGATLYKMLTNRPPFTGTDIIELARQHREDPIQPPFEVNPRISGGASDLVGWMMAKDPNDRPQSYDELFGVLDELIGPREQWRAPSIRSAPPRPPAPIGGPAKAPPVSQSDPTRPLPHE